MKKFIHRIIGVFGFIFSASLWAQTPEQVQKIISQYDLNELLQMENQHFIRMSSEKERVLEWAKTNDIPLVVEENGTYKELQNILEDGTLLYYTTFNLDAARSTRTNHLQNSGSLGLNLMGQNMTAHIWDGGLARTSHQEYDGAGGNNRFSIGDGTNTLNFHAAHVTGTIIASGVQNQAKGMAPYARARGFDWNNDLQEATSAASSGMLVSNHSYGWDGSTLPDYYFGAYVTTSRDWDNLLFNAPYYLMVVAAGNDGQANYNGSPMENLANYDKLTGHATSKNNLVVANAQDASIDSNGNLINVVINATSSQGPTDDYRIKPDITGNGTGVYSTYQNSDTAYNTISGTSMASPNVTGSLLLLQEHYENLNSQFMRAATLKGLALHTADDAGTFGPDVIFGWGLLNAKKAAETITLNGNGSLIQELVINTGQTLEFTVNSDGISQLQASISWTDRPGTASTTLNSTTPRLVNDLDLRVSKNGTTHLPWRLTSVTTNARADNNLDPFERIDVDNASGTYTIKITPKGNLTGGSQQFSLIITGIANPSCLPAIQSFEDGESCGTGTAEIQATANAETTELRLYTQQLGGTPIATINGNSGTFTTPSISETTNFFIAAADGNCESNRVMVKATVLPIPTELIINRTDFPENGGACDFQYAELNVSGGEEFHTLYSEDFSALGNNQWAFGGTNDRVMAYYYPSNNAGGVAPEAGMQFEYGGNTSNGNWYLVPYNIVTNNLMSIPITGYDDLTLSFKHMFDHYNGYNSNLHLDVSLDGTNYTSVWNSLSITQDIPASNISVDLSAYEGNDELYIRFRYNGDSYGIDYWYFDDVKIEGTLQGEITWSPIDGLFLDAQLSIPYNGENLATVYAAPSENKIYSASIESSSNDCVVSASEEIFINIMQFVAGTGNWDTPQNWSPSQIPTIDNCIKVPENSSLLVNIPNAEAKTVQIDPGGSLVISSGNSLTIADDLLNYSDANSLLLSNDANLIQKNDLANNTGSMKVEKEFIFTNMPDPSDDRKQYNFVISPVKNQSIKTIYSGNPTVIYFNETQNYFYNSDGSYIEGRGLAVREPSKSAVPANTVTAAFVGEPANGILGYTLSYTTTNPNVDHGYNLVGNPYPSNLDIQKLYLANQTRIQPHFYFWDNRGNEVFSQFGSNYNGHHYASFNAVAGGGTGSAAPGASGELRIPNKFVKVGTGFMVQARNTAHGETLQFENEFRSSGSGVGFHGKTENFESNVDRYWLTMKTPKNLNVMNAVVYFAEGNNQYSMDDTDTFGGSDDFYSIVDDKKLSIQGKAPFLVRDVVPLGFKVFESGNYEISIYQKEGVFAESRKIYLIDKLLNKIHNLSQSNYSFQSEAGEFNNRFRIVYTPLASGGNTILNLVYLFKENKQIVVNSTQEKILELEIFSLNNSSLYNLKNINQKQWSLPSTLFGKQILFFKIKTESGVVETRKFINN